MIDDWLMVLLVGTDVNILMTRYCGDIVEVFWRWIPHV